MKCEFYILAANGQGFKPTQAGYHERKRWPTRALQTSSFGEGLFTASHLRLIVLMKIVPDQSSLVALSNLPRSYGPLGLAQMFCMLLDCSKSYSLQPSSRCSLFQDNDGLETHMQSPEKQRANARIRARTFHDRGSKAH